MLRYDLYDFSDAHIVVKGDINVTKKIFTADDFERPHNTNLNAINTNNAMQRTMCLVKNNWFLKIMHHLLIVSQKLMA